MDELDECQQANGNGNVGAIPSGKKIFAEIAAGDIRQSNEVFVFSACGFADPIVRIAKPQAAKIQAAYLPKVPSR